MQIAHAIGKKAAMAMNTEHRIQLDSFIELSDRCNESSEDLNLLMSIIESIEDYHRAIIRESTYYTIFTRASSDEAGFFDEYERLDQARTAAHNLMLQHVSMLNNLARLHGMQELYPDEISEKAPMRRQVADAALCLMEEIIKNRS